MELTVELEEGDVLIVNEKQWIVDNRTPLGKFDLQPKVGEMRCMSREEIQEMLDYAGDVRIVKQDYVDVM